ncbi:MAG: UDP-N-acetylglucosamine 2-epimerase (non-hydrolyzing) [Firmicutes bacterium]|nr:UDP-N-acetylglucosamine 2-epimerase (non-hydrolyzing) [Bacillota bacterium]
MKILNIFGTRPEAVKMVPVIQALSAVDEVDNLVCVTAQHRELLDEVLTPFNIVPNYDLNLMKERQTLTELTAAALVGIGQVIQQSKPDWVLVHGDTATTLSASLAAFYNKVKVGHIEAGLRSYDKYQPFPEEINRKVATAIADYHFAPTELAKNQLINENIPQNTIFVTGNTGIDIISTTVKTGYQFRNKDIQNVNGKILLMTAHRRENWGEPLENICKAVKQLALDFPDITVVYPVHPNPVVKETVFSILANCTNIILTEPLNIFDMHNLMAKSYLVLTDSGGLQEEAPALDKPVVVLREVTERPEGETAGTLLLAGTNQQKIYNSVKILLTDQEKYNQMSTAKNPFGDGKAAKRIVEILLKK